MLSIPRQCNFFSTRIWIQIVFCGMLKQDGTTFSDSFCRIVKFISETVEINVQSNIHVTFTFLGTEKYKVLCHLT